MSGASAVKSTPLNPIRLSIPSGASGFVSVLLGKTLRSRTFKLALVSIGVFGAMVIALFNYVYWSTASFVRTRSDRAILAELVKLQTVYASASRSGLVSMIAQRLADQRFEGGVYLLASP